MALRPADFKSAASTGFATQACGNGAPSAPQTEIPAVAGIRVMEAEVGIEPAYADLQSAA
jgi:hypothetical protein